MLFFYLYSVFLTHQTISQVIIFMFQTKRLLIACLFVHALATANASLSLIENVCVPRISNFDKSVYKASNQIWAVAQAKNGYMYFGNSQGLIEYDGTQWTLYQLPNIDKMVRCVNVDEQDLIYTGGQNEFGYWKCDSLTRRLRYKSLSGALHLNEESIWKIIILDQYVYFHSFKNIYKYDSRAKHFTVIKAPTHFQFIFKVGKRIFVEDKVQGMFELINNRLVAIAGGNLLNFDCMYGMAALPNNEILIAANGMGLFKIKNNEIVKCNLPCEAFLRENQVFSLCVLPNGRLAFGTILNGVLITDLKGNILANYNKQKGLTNNTVLSMLADKSGNLWLGLDHGIAHIHINSAVKDYADPYGRLGSVYDIKEYEDNVYFATNQGVYTCKTSDMLYPHREPKLSIVPKSQGQSWNLQYFDGQLFCCHNKGLLKVTPSGLVSIYKTAGANKFLKINEQIAVFSTYEGLCVLRKSAQGYDISNIGAYPYFALYLAKDSNNVIYTGNSTVGMYRIQFDHEFKSVISVTNKFAGISYHTSGFKGVYSDSENLYILSQNGVLLNFDYKQRKFFPNKRLTALIAQLPNVNNIAIREPDMWCFSPGSFFCIRNYASSDAYILPNNMQSLFNKMVNRYENIIRLNDKKYLACTSTGFSVINNLNPAKKAKNLHVIIRDIGTFKDSMQHLELKHSIAYYSNTPIEFPNNHAPIFIRFTLPLYRDADKITYSYQLKGNMENFSIPSSSNMVTFPHLPAGEYRFQVKATVQGTNEVYYSQELLIKIRSPWYLGWGGLILLFCLAGIGAYGGNKYLRNRLRRQQVRIAEEHEKEMSKKDTQILQEQIRLQNEELSRITKTMLRKNKLMNKLDDEITRIAESKTIPGSNLRGLRNIVEMHKNPEEEWKVFELSFNNAHNNYLVNLSTRFPSLTTSDLKLAAYIRMNISSKEIATLLNISIKSVEMARYRLRKKLEIEHEQNLTSFLMSI